MENKVKAFELAMNWIRQNTIANSGIAVTNVKQKIYPEVTGYYIPSLLRWGEKNLAVAYAQYLCRIQKEDGSWYDCEDSSPYVFDSAQILKGLLSIRNLLPQVDEHIIKGCDWILSNMQQDGRLVTPDREAWGNDESFCSELIHIYCLSPIKEAGNIFDRQDYIESVDKILNYYINNKKKEIENFSLLSHFYAYVMEGLYDLGQIDLCRECMMRLEKYRNKKGGIPGLNDVPWICSTGLFQLALVWYKLGDLQKGNSLFEYALLLQNKSGGWYGSYPALSNWRKIYWGKKKPYYFPNEEISWANKYFLDSLAYKERLEFDKMSSSFMDTIDKTDGRYVLVSRLLKDSANKWGKLLICDVGCGKGRYLHNLMEEFPENEYYALDLSSSVMKEITTVTEKKTGALTDIPYAENSFDLVYACEAFEHAINLRGAFYELYRIVKPGGRFVIIDKPVEALGCMEIDEWEQWIEDADMRRFAEECGGKLEIIKSVSYENNKDDGLFRAWIVTKENSQ